MNEKGFAFVICSNNELLLNECLEYISLLQVPEGYSVDLRVITGASSMLEGMDEGRAASDAKYKIYMHQDVYILNKFFLYDLLTVFESDSKIGVVGMVGTPKMPANGVMWSGSRVGNLYSRRANPTEHRKERFRLSDGLLDVNAVDGLLIATAYDDVAFRKDLLDGWDFYDVSTSLEYKKAGYRVVVPEQKFPWVLHDDGMILSMWNYDKYRKIILEEYKEFF